MAKKYYEEIDLLKGIAITLVVLGHSVIVYPINLHDIFWCRTIYDFVRTTHMPLFFLVSGFCFSIKTGYGEYLWKKTRRIFLPYVLFNLIDMVPRALFSALVHRPRSIRESLTVICYEGGAYWFLYSLYLIFLIFPLLAPLMRTKWGKLAVCLVCLGLKFVPGLPRIFLIRRTIYHLLYFVVGYCLRDTLQIEDVRTFVNRNRWLSVILSFALPAVILALCPVYTETGDSQLLGIPLAFIGITTALLIAVQLKGGVIREHLLGFGRYSLQIYLLNGFLLTLSRSFIVLVLHIQTPAAIILFNWFVNLVVSYYLIKWIFSRFGLTRAAFGIV